MTGPSRKSLFIVLFLLAVLPRVALGANGGEHSMTHRMMMLVIQLGLILFAAKLGSILFEKIHLPGVIGELAAGMVIGPYALGGLGFIGFSDGLFPTLEGGMVLSPELQGIAAIAAVVLLFNVGLETNLSLLLRYAVAGGLVGIGGVAISFVLGDVTLMYFSKAVLGRSAGFLDPACLLSGVIATATSVGISARILSEKRKLDSPEGVTILSAAVIDDIIGIILLAVVLGMVSATRLGGGSVDWAHIGMIAVKAVSVWLIATTIGLVASRKISHLLKWFGERTSIAIMALGLALILAGLFEEAGLAMIIGAYVMGLSLSRADIANVVRERIHGIYAFLVPVFFCATGMQFNLTSLDDPSLLLFGGVYTLGALVSKVVGCGLPSLAAGFNIRGALRVGFGMAPRGEVVLIIAGIGLTANMLSPSVFAAVVIMVIGNSLLAPAAMVLLFRSPRPGLRESARKVHIPEEQLTFDFPTQEMSEFFIGKLLEVFESEGFFVHQMHRGHDFYELRKEEAVIGLQHEDRSLIFNCHRADAGLVNAAVYETIAAVEQTMQGLKEPMDAEDVQASLQSPQLSQRRSFRIGDYLSPSLVVPRLKGETKEEVIDELLGVLEKHSLIGDLRSARRAVWKREQSMSTGLQYGVAIPHGKTDAVNRLVCAVGIKPEGIDFGSLDDQPSRIFVLTLSPLSKPAPHVQFMSAVSSALTSEGRSRVLACATPREICEVFTAQRPSRRAAATAPAAPGGKLRLSDYLSPKCCLPSMPGRTKEEIIIALVDCLDEAGKLLDRDKALQDVLARESQLSTGMEEGLAVPHARSETVQGLTCAVGTTAEGIDYGSADGKPSRIFVLVLTQPGGRDPYLQLVATLIGELDAAGRQAAMRAQTPEELYNALVSNGTS